jgi:hypothetical protein
MQIEYGCCVTKDIRFFKGFTEEKGCVVMCPVCQKELALVGHHTDAGVYDWRDQAIKNNMYFKSTNEKESK